MTIANFLYQRPRIFVVVTLLLSVSGIGCLITRPVAEDPESKPRAGIISVSWPGASAERVESEVAKAVEDAVCLVDGIRSIESTSHVGFCVAFVRLNDDVRDVKHAWSQLRHRLAECRTNLPSGASDPILEAESIWDAKTISIALRWNCPEACQPTILSRWGHELENRLQFLKGTRFTEVKGKPEVEIHVDVDHAQLASMKLKTSDVVEQIKAHNAISERAAMTGDEYGLSITTIGRLSTLDQIAQIPLRSNQSAGLVRIGDIADIRRGVKREFRSMALINVPRLTKRTA